MHTPLRFLADPAPLAPLEVFQDPCVVTAADARAPRLDLGRPFEVRRWILLGGTRGRLFTAATGDPNPLHTHSHGIVPGAFLIAQCVASLEVLAPQLRLAQLKLSLTRVASYGQSLEFVLQGAPDPTGVSVRCRVLQAGHEVARGSITGTPGRAAPPAAGAPVPPALADYCDAMGLAPEPFLERAGPGLPRSFLCTLPSGQLVRDLGGEGGLLNRVTLSFSGELAPLAEAPRVELGLPKRARSTFNRIALEVRSGDACPVSGSALVLPRPAAPSLRALAC